MMRGLRGCSAFAPLLLLAACAGEDGPVPASIAGRSELPAMLAPWASLSALTLRPSLERVGDAYRPRFEGMEQARVHVEVPAVAGEPLRVRDARSGVALQVRPLGLVAEGVAAEVVAGKAIFRDALGAGAHLVHAPLRHGSEELVVLDGAGAAGAANAISWELEVGAAAAGVRLVANTVEVLDEGGAPRLRMAPPWVEDARGVRRWAQVELRGCAHDTSTAPPWGRTPIAPGGSCQVTLRWDGAGLTYPLLVDPEWATADGLGVPRGQHQATLLAGGRVLVTGGASSNFEEDAGLASAELYDPPTDSWGATGAMSTPRFEHVSERLPDGRVLVAGGRTTWLGPGIPSAETFDPVTGLFAATGSMGVGRAAPASVVLGSGRVLVTGGVDAGDNVVGTAQTYDGASDTWAPAGSFIDARSHHTVTLLVDGRVLLIGGHQNLPQSAGDYPISASIYDETVGGWQPVADWETSRGWHTATRLDDGRVVVVGGFIPSVFVTLTDIYDPGANAWSSGPALTPGREEHTATKLGSGSVLVSGGTVSGARPGVAYPTNESWLLLPDASAWVAADPNTAFRYAHTATLLDDGRTLLAGGYLVDGVSYAAQAAVEIFGQVPDGGICNSAAECASGSCVDSFCCDTACDGICESCVAAVKGSGDNGVCGPIAAGTDPQGECLDGGAAACQQNGLCDGAGACQNYDAGCVAKPCGDATDCSSGICSVDGVCCDAQCNGVCESCLATANGSEDGKCLPVVRGTDPDHECPSDSEFDCGSIALCNGALACEPAVSLCAPYVCLDDTACRIGCDSDADCVDTHRCDDGACVPRVAGCEGSVAIAPDGTEVQCSPYLCLADGSCRTSCGSAADCADGFVCDSAGQCVGLGEGGGEGDDGGCGCRVAGAPAQPARTAGSAAWLLLGSLLLLRRRGCRALRSRRGCRDLRSRRNIGSGGARPS